MDKKIYMKNVMTGTEIHLMVVIICANLSRDGNALIFLLSVSHFVEMEEFSLRKHAMMEFDLIKKDAHLTVWM